MEKDTEDKVYTRWEQDYNLADIPTLGLFDEYLEMGKYRKAPKNSDIQKKIAVIILKFEQGGFIIENCVQKIQMEWQTV